MKKFLLVLVLLSASLVFASCGGEEDASHQHEKTLHWLHDGVNHWLGCSGCEEKFDEAKHTFGEWKVTKEASLTEKGSKERVCSVCDYKETEEIPVVDHAHEKTDWVSDANGHWKGCIGCEEKFDEGSHEYGEWRLINDSTETQEGSKSHACTVCKYVETVTIPVKDHTHEESDWVSDDVNHWKTCSKCTDELEKGAHNYEPTVVGSTVTFKCDVCEKEKVEDEYYLVGKLLEKPQWSNYEDFTVLARRNADNISIRLVSTNNVFSQATRNSRVELYFVVGDKLLTREGNEGVTRINITSTGAMTVFNYGAPVNSDGISYSIKGTNCTVVDLVVPYSVLGAQSDDIFGISCGLWSENDTDWAPMYSLDSNVISSVEVLSQYVRCDKDNLFFESPINDYKENIPQPEYSKEELIVGYPFGVADPVNVFDENADEIYLKVNKNAASFTFDMIGFGTLESNEYLKLIIHTSDVDGNGWNLQASDVTFLISSTKAAYKTEQTFFWDYVNFSEGETNAMNTPVYSVDESGYFRLSFDVEFEEIPDYRGDIEISFIMLEFHEGLIYNGDPVDKAMTEYGMGVGDPALQSSYRILQERQISVDKDSILDQYAYKFSTDYYANIVKGENGLKVSLVSFNPLANNFVRLIIDTDGVAALGGWALDVNDVSFMIYKDKAYMATGENNFWNKENTQFHSGDETINTPIYTEYQDYWTIELEIQYDELGLNINQDSPLKAMLIAFTPVIQNHGFNFAGMVPGDVADQNFYFVINK